VGDAAYNEWRLALLSPWPRWALLLLALLAAAAVALALRGLAGEPWRRRGALLALRATACLVALFLVAEPAVQLLQTARVKGRFAVLVDASRSMNFPAGAGGEPRTAVAAAAARAARERLAGLADRVNVEWWRFDREAAPSDAASLAAGGRAEGAGTDLLGALRAAGAGGAGRQLAGALVLSDGADHGALEGGVGPAERAELRALGFPVSTLSVADQAPRDLAIERAAADEFAFVRSTVRVEVTLRARGFGGERVDLVLRREGAVVASARVDLRPGQERYTATLQFVPQATGTFVLTAAAPVFPGEAIAENNARSFVLRVIRDRVRVLLVAGRPTWDERFLRGLLKQDPNVDLVSFYILRTNTDEAGPQEELSLIPFPVAEIFGEQLRTFDAVLFVNFAYGPYRALDIERHLPALRDWIRAGGGFAMLGGDQSFGEGRYGTSALAEVLPVEALEGLGVAAAESRARLTGDGRRHPVTALATGEGANDSAWGALPALPALNRTRALPAESGAQVLLEAPAVQVEGRPAPLVAVREAGAGRVLAVATDHSWFWGFVAAEESGSARAYQRFWTNALRWLVRDPDLAPVKVEPDRPVFQPGEGVGASVTVRAPDWGPAAGAPVVVELVAEDGKPVARAEGAAGPDGVAHVTLPPPPPGAYGLAAQAWNRCAAAPCPPGVPPERASGAVAVRAGPEDLDAAPRPDLLRAVAEATGGRHTAARAGLPELPFVEAEAVEIGRRKDVPIWDRGWALALLATALAGEWALRRRWGRW
jgi:uncharacterized membrane protein